MKATDKRDDRIRFIAEYVFDYFGLDKGLIKSASHKGELIKAKHIAIFISKKFRFGSYAVIGSHFPSKKSGVISVMDHSTTLKACDSVNNQMLFNKQYRDDITMMIQELAGILDVGGYSSNLINDFYMSNDMFTIGEIETGQKMLIA